MARWGNKGGERRGVCEYGILAPLTMVLLGERVSYVFKLLRRGWVVGSFCEVVKFEECSGGGMMK